MNRFKINAFFQEFPFLASLINVIGKHDPDVLPRNYIEEVKVSRIDRAFLEKTPKYEGATGSLVGIRDSERIILISAKGSIGLIRKIVSQAKDICHNEVYLDDENEEGETVGDALSKIKNPNTVTHAVCIHTGYRIRGHHSVGGYSLTVYKPPKGFTLKEWIEEQERRAKEMLDAEIVEIDAEAN